jgi:Protein of unknown function (DUF4242)
MATYLAEVYAPEATELTELAGQVRTAAEALARDGIAVRYLRSILIPEDETCFHVLEAPSTEAVAETGSRASLTFSRIVEALT